jgi:deoxyribodipyrimidine photo-lyase
MANALVWFRRDLRLADNPALQAALASAYAPIPVYVHAPDEDAPWAPGAASRAWLDRSLRALARELDARGSRLLVRWGPGLAALEALVAETGAEAVFWNRLYEPAAIARDRAVKQALAARGVLVRSSNGALLAEPWTVATAAGEPCRVFTPFWKKVRPRLEIDASAPVDAPARLPAVDAGVASEPIDALGLAPAPAWDARFWDAWRPGEAGAQASLEAFLADALDDYDAGRDRPDRDGTSRLSPHLHFGEISPRQVAARVLARNGAGAEAADSRERLLAELGWREFAHHLLYHFPHSAEADFNLRFAGFAWNPPDAAWLRAWQAGRTGVPIVDAGMRQLWATGWMHNRVRMVVASFLCKNLRLHWTHGARWFWDTLVDADLASNTLGWQWSAGTGADAAPYFRIFNPVTQARRFDPDGDYVRRWVPELAHLPTRALFAPWEHPEALRQHAPDYPSRPVVDLAASRAAALAAFAQLRPRPAESTDAADAEATNAGEAAVGAA